MKKSIEKIFNEGDLKITITAFKNESENIVFTNDERFLNNNTYRIINKHNEFVIYLVAVINDFNNVTKQLIYNKLNEFKGEL